MVRKKKDVIKPVVAKPLNDTQKRNLVTNFVTSNIKDNVTDNVIKDDIKVETNNINATQNNTDMITSNETNSETDSITNIDTVMVNENITEVFTKSETNKSTKSVTKRVPKKVTITKVITLGKKEIVAKFTSDKKQRPNYNLSEDTIEKIEKISDILGYKKAEFVDIYLNGTLEKVLKDLEKLL